MGHPYLSLDLESLRLLRSSRSRGVSTRVAAMQAPARWPLVLMTKNSCLLSVIPAQSTLLNQFSSTRKNVRLDCHVVLFVVEGLGTI